MQTFRNQLQGILFWLRLFNLCPWVSYHMILNAIFPNIPCSLPDLHWPMANQSSYPGYFRESHWISMGLKIFKVTSQECNGFVHSIKVYKIYYLHFHVIAMHWFKPFSTTMIESLGQDANWRKLGVKGLHNISGHFVLNSIGQFALHVHFPLQQTQKTDIDRKNETEMKLTKTISSKVK